jgi:hypothetical protein
LKKYVLIVKYITNKSVVRNSFYTVITYIFVLKFWSAIYIDNIMEEFLSNSTSQLVEVITEKKRKKKRKDDVIHLFKPILKWQLPCYFRTYCSLKVESKTKIE